MNGQASAGAGAAVVDGASTAFSAESFFSTQDPPPQLHRLLEGVADFVAFHAREQRRVVLVTSGGTTVPLEHNVVRFLDNFSAGTRGAASAEQFLRTGKYAVIFMHRQHSLQPFSRHYSHSTNPFLDLLETTPSHSLHSSMTAPGSEQALFPNLHAAVLRQKQSTLPQSTPSAIQVVHGEQNAMKTILDSYKTVKSRNLLHTVSFVTVFDYLFLLRGIARLMNGSPERGPSVGPRGLYYLAAAVSDFFLPQQKMSEHKIQSGKGSLVIEMDQVPKILSHMVKDWGAEGFVVSFKLETDKNLIIPKARQALERYGHQVVVGNDLATRKHEVVFVQRDHEEWVRISEKQVAEGAEIEEEIVARLTVFHEQHISKASK